MMRTSCPKRVDRLGYKSLAHDLVQTYADSPILHQAAPSTALEQDAESSMEIS